jgi:hypothetical protein
LGHGLGPVEDEDRERGQLWRTDAGCEICFARVAQKTDRGRVDTVCNVEGIGFGGHLGQINALESMGLTYSIIRVDCGKDIVGLS